MRRRRESDHRVSSTARLEPRPVVLVVGSQVLHETCTEAASGGLAAVRACSVGSLANEAAAWRPLAIVLTRDVLSFDRTEFEALARDVGARLVVVADETISALELRHELITLGRAPAAALADTPA